MWSSQACDIFQAALLIRTFINNDGVKTKSLTSHTVTKSELTEYEAVSEFLCSDSASILKKQTPWMVGSIGVF